MAGYGYGNWGYGQYNPWMMRQGGPPMGWGWGGWGWPGAGYGPTWAGGGWGLGGLRQWGGTYSTQFATTGLPTDEEITEMVFDAIDDDPLIPWDADIDVNVDAGEVTLTGAVDERHTKRLAEDVAERVSGVKEVHNQIRVQRMAQSGSVLNR